MFGVLIYIYTHMYHRNGLQILELRTSGWCLISHVLWLTLYEHCCQMYSHVSRQYITYFVCTVNLQYSPAECIRQYAYNIVTCIWFWCFCHLFRLNQSNASNFLGPASTSNFAVWYPHPAEECCRGHAEEPLWPWTPPGQAQCRSQRQKPERDRGDQN